MNDPEHTYWHGYASVDEYLKAIGRDAVADPSSPTANRSGKWNINTKPKRLRGPNVNPSHDAIESVLSIYAESRSVWRAANANSLPYRTTLRIINAYRAGVSP